MFGWRDEVKRGKGADHNFEIQILESFCKHPEGHNSCDNNVFYILFIFNFTDLPNGFICIN